MKLKISGGLKVSAFLLFVMLFVGLLTGFNANGQQTDSMNTIETDTLFRKGELDSAMNRAEPFLTAGAGIAQTINIDAIQRQPFISLQQMLKGRNSGLYVQEPTGEPGTEQYMFIRGVGRPLLSKADVYSVQPVVFLNGVPLIGASGMEYGIQKTEINPVGPATNVLAAINPATIESIEVLKDPAQLAKLGPLAANGAIWVVTKNARSGKKVITIDSYFGAISPFSIEPVNAGYENNFRQPYYKKYGNVNSIINYPVYLRDSTDLAYYGPANWTDLYFKNALVYGITPSLTVGTDKANFRFQLNHERGASGQDAANLNRYGFSFFINMLPVRWLTVSSMVSGTRLDRDGNRNFRDRLAETRYIPDMANPLPPGKDMYAAYLREFDKAIDDRKVTSLQGYFTATAKPITNLSIQSKLLVDYNEQVRDVFWPSTLLAGNNFVSNYFGYNQRFMINNTAEYLYNINEKNKIAIEAGQQFLADVYKYDYGFGYNTPNDFIKVRTITMDGAVFSMPYFPLVEKMNHALASFYGQVAYSYKNLLKLSGTLRRDGSSFVQPNKRWISTPTISLWWDAKNSLKGSSSLSALSAFSLRASYGRLGNPFNTDRFSVGPNYVVDVAWPAEPHIGSYVGIGASSRPYTKGWVGYGIGWQYADKMNLGLDFGFFNDRVRLSVDVYNEDNKNMVLPIPVPKEYGYTVAYEPGMAVNNKGIDVQLNGLIIDQPERFQWESSINLSYNKNRLSSLPRGMSDIVINNVALRTGQPIDAFWLFQNNGVYNNLSEIPVNSKTGLRQSFKGIELNVSDPKWADLNGDFDINDEDRVMTGHFIPTLTGGWFNSLSYKRIGFSFLFYFATGHKMLNTHIADRLSFVNNDGSRDVNSVKEIAFWQKTFNPSDYPMYNPWSDVVPYRQEQDLFLQDASFVKLRSLSITYDLLTDNGFFKKGTFNRCQVYLSGTNLFTISKVKGFDPELANYRGIYTGYNQYLPRIFSAGVKLSF